MLTVFKITAILNAQMLNDTIETTAFCRLLSNINVKMFDTHLQKPIV
jgi:hypothetical protein